MLTRNRMDLINKKFTRIPKYPDYFVSKKFFLVWPLRDFT